MTQAELLRHLHLGFLKDVSPQIIDKMCDEDVRHKDSGSLDYSDLFSMYLISHLWIIGNCLKISPTQLHVLFCLVYSYSSFLCTQVAQFGGRESLL